jgi:hypothetical protein
MRWFILILGLLAAGGCASSGGERHERLAKWFKDWWDSGDSGSDSYQYQSDASKAHHEQTVINTLNGWIGNRPYSDTPSNR